MSRFALNFPYFIIVCCLMVCVVGFNSLIRMPVDLFPQVKIPVVVVATFFSGMPAEQVENDITGRFERFFTLGSGIDHIESKSLPGVSLIKIYFQSGTDADAAVTEISNLAMADLRRLPPGTLPPVVLKFDASSLPVCLITLKADGMTEAQLRDLGQYNVRNQVASIPGASIPQPFGGKYRQIMVYVDPEKLEAHQLSLMDVVRSVNNSNLILPSGDVKIGPYDYNLFTNSQIDDVSDIKNVPLKTIGTSSVMVGDVAEVKDAAQIQLNRVDIDGQPSVYLPVLKQGGDSNTIAIVEGVKNAVAHLMDVPKNLVAKVVFDQSIFVKNAIHNLVHEGVIGLLLTGVMILIFLGSFRATAGVFLSIPLSALTTFIVLSLGGNTINAMILGGLALAFSRLVDNSVVVLENIFRHLEGGMEIREACERGGREMALPVLAATLTTAIVFFPVTMLFGVSKYLFTALAVAVVLALFASYVVAMTVVPLFCAKFLKNVGHHVAPAEKVVDAFHSATWGVRFNLWFNRQFEKMLKAYDSSVIKIMRRPATSLAMLLGFCAALMLAFPFLGKAYFPRTDPGQFVVNIKSPTGTRLEDTAEDVKKLEAIIRRTVDPKDMDVIASNIGVTPGFSSIYTSNTGSHSAFIQVSLKESHKTGSYVYMDRVRHAVQEEMPELTTYFQSGGLVDAVLNMGLPAPIDVQVSGNNLERDNTTAQDIARQVRAMPDASDVFIPQDMDAPSLQINVNREHASEMGLSQKEVVDNIITALTSNQMIAPSYWVDPKSGNDYMLTAQYPEDTVKTLDDLKAIPVRSDTQKATARLDTLTDIKPMTAPTVVNHYQMRRVIDIYAAPKSEDLGALASGIQNIIAKTQLPENVTVNLRGSFEAMNTSFSSFATGLLLSVLLIYLVLVAQFKSFIDPFVILLAVPPGIGGAVVMLLMTGTTLNVMSLMGMVMMVGIVVSNSILIVEFAHRLREGGRNVVRAIMLSCRVRLRPILMTSLATIIGLIPMALALGAGSEAYASLARVIIGGLTVSLVMTVFIVPAAYLLVYGRPMKNPEEVVPRSNENYAGIAASIILALVFCAAPAMADNPAPAQTLTLENAKALALQNHPQLKFDTYETQAAKADITIARSNYFPQVSGDAIRVFANNNTRITAPGGINDPTVLDRGAAGIGVTQLITDFGRTNAQVDASKFAYKAQSQRADLSRAEVIFNVSNAYYNALRAQAMMKVAEDTIKTRQTLVDQVSALHDVKMKSDLDLSIARQGMDDAHQLLIHAQSNLDDAMAELSESMGSSETQSYILADENSVPPPDQSVDALVQTAINNNPELAAVQSDYEAAQKNETAADREFYPTLSAVGYTGATPIRSASEHLNPNYAAVGINLSIPLFTGGRLSAGADKAAYQANAAKMQIEVKRNQLVRDIHTAFDRMQTAYKNIAVTQSMLENAEQSLTLTQARYDIGKNSIVDLSQVQLAETQAAVAKANATYEYLADRAALDYKIGRYADNSTVY